MVPFGGRVKLRRLLFCCQRLTNVFSTVWIYARRIYVQGTLSQPSRIFAQRRGSLFPANWIFPVSLSKRNAAAIRGVSGPKAATRMVVISPKRAACSSEIQATCLQIRENNEPNWRLFYGHIDGFDPKEGVGYLVRVKETEAPDPSPGHASSKQWVLEKVVTSW
jgi:hypothetical protein